MFENIQRSVDNIMISFMKFVDKSSFGIKQKIFFLKELAYLIWWGVDILASLDVIYNSSDNYAIKDICTILRHYISQWKTLSYAMSRIHDYFDESDYNIIRIWEKSWDLPNVLDALAQEYNYLNDVKNKYISAMMYPFILIIISLVAILSMFILVLPNIFSIADQFNVENLPWMTTVLRDFSFFIENQWIYVLSILAFLSFLWYIYVSTEQWKKKFFNLVLQIPVLGKMTKYYYIIKWCRYMRLMFRSGMSYLQTFQLLRNVLWVAIYQDMVENIIKSLQKWDNIHTSLRSQWDIIPSDVIALIKVGEETANLSNSIDNILDMYEWELDNMITRMSKIIEPIMLVFVWWIVVIIALWVFGLILHIMEGI